MGMWEKRRDPDLSHKGTLGTNTGRIRVAGGRDTPYIPIVGINNDTLTLWFEVVRIDGIERGNQQISIAFQHLPGFEGDGLHQFDIDAWVHSSDGQLKIAVLGWRGDGDATRDCWVLRTGFYYNDLA